MSARERILVIGDGGREHALAWRLSRDPETEWLGVAPGNDGMRATFDCVDVSPVDLPAQLELARRVRATLVVVGPEAPLAAGVVDAFEGAGITCYGPGREAARLESSKWFAKQVMHAAGVPTASAECCRTLEAARAALAMSRGPWVLKADGLAAGKGVCVTSEAAEAEAFARACLEDQRFGAAGASLLIETYLVGEEVSMLAVCDGERFVLLPPARDYKRAHDGDRGPNTGGMGAYAPALALDAALETRIGAEVVAPVLREMAARGMSFKGTLFVGLMLTQDGPQVLEFNVRFGDPETEALVPLIDGSLTRLLAGAARGKLDRTAVTRAPGATVSVALCAAGYPEAIGEGGIITGLEAIDSHPECQVFHAGTRRVATGWEVRGGRAAHVVARASDLATARTRAYAAVAALGGSGWRVRHDIASPDPVAAGIEGRA
ncbi:MAG: phosphoribosylamine--glycine ligase [Candidatus Eisenbacteria bacterium]|uniref:Phosphoribosylamine--glycine ligase n=1 Tax=Eiseniibacteriota bacterium TaxID=2212470 RepID=A0A849SL05_UNCEI|nr:phosphoribosylamine--glycine ligase [Candidatus Eisenbacteria bacterium]